MSGCPASANAQCNPLSQPESVTHLRTCAGGVEKRHSRCTAPPSSTDTRRPSQESLRIRCTRAAPRGGRLQDLLERRREGHVRNLLLLSLLFLGSGAVLVCSVVELARLRRRESTGARRRRRDASIYG